VEHAESEQARIPGRAWESRESFWSPCDWLPCTDGKARPVEPGSFPLAHGVLKRASKLRAYGNAIVPQVAAEFIRSTLDIL
jgi:DNA (cytosine-5)-methyltransferase 1